MGFKFGIIGLPNVGKSTLFNALTKSKIPAENFPFCTIKPNIAIVPVPDIRLKKLSKIVNSKKIIHANMEFIDVAGLIKGASSGEGLGNQFLNYIYESQAIGHVVRCFDQPEILHIYNEVNPIHDVQIVNNELILADLQKCRKFIFHIEKNKKSLIHQEIIKVLQKCCSYLEKNQLLRTLKLNLEEKKIIKNYNFLTLKPTLYIANLNKNKIIKNDYLESLISIAKKENSFVLSICAKDIDIKKNKITSEFENMKLQKIIQAGFNLLKLQTFFTVGKKEIHAWTIPINTTAFQASKKIHSDFQKGFIRAQIISFNDFIQYNNEYEIKKNGKIKLVGKDYLVQDGDIIKFLFNV